MIIILIIVIFQKYLILFLTCFAMNALSWLIFLKLLILIFKSTEKLLVLKYQMKIVRSNQTNIFIIELFFLLLLAISTDRIFSPVQNVIHLALRFNPIFNFINFFKYILTFKILMNCKISLSHLNSWEWMTTVAKSD